TPSRLASSPARSTDTPRAPRWSSRLARIGLPTLMEARKTCLGVKAERTTSVAGCMTVSVKREATVKAGSPRDDLLGIGRRRPRCDAAAVPPYYPSGGDGDPEQD